MSANEEQPTKQTVFFVERAFRSSWYLAICIAGTLFGAVLGDTELAVAVGIACVVSAVWIIWSEKVSFVGSRLARWYFLYCAIHAVLGYLGAAPAIYQINAGSGIQRSLRQSFFVVSCSLLCAAVGYSLSSGLAGLHERNGRSSSYLGPISLDKLTFWARLLAVAGILVMVYVVERLGYLPILASSPGAARYLTESLSPEFMKYDWILEKALDLLRCSVPLLLFSAIRYRRLSDWLLGPLSFLALSIPLRRADLISCFVVVMLMFIAHEKRLLRKIAVAAVILLLAYIGTQVFLLAGNKQNDEAGIVLFQKAILSGLPEVRDLGWMIDSLHGEELEGMTFVQAMNPFPTFASESKQKYALGYVTMRLAGFEPGSTSGGLRIMLAGEWFLNFGILGVAIGGILAGVVARLVVNYVDWVMEKRDEPRMYLAVQIVAWLGMWVYLAGTEAFGVFRNGLILILVMIFLSRIRTKSIRIVASLRSI